MLEKMCKYLPSWPTFVGSVVMLVGVTPGVLWVLDYVDYIRPNSDPEQWPILLMSSGLLGIGAMLAGGKGETIGEAFMWWFKKRAQIAEEHEDDA